MKRTLVSLSVLVFAGTLILDASAQGTPTTKKAAAKPSTRSRARRVAEPADKVSPAKESTDAKPAAAASTVTSPSESNSTATKTAPAATETASKPQTTQEPAKSDVTAKAAPVSEKPAVLSSDPVTELREQIETTEVGPERIKLQLKLADTLVTSGHRTEALKELNSIAGLDVFDPPGFYNLGNAFARLGETDGAVNAYQKSIEQREGNYSRAYNNLGVVLLRAGRWDEAHEAFLKALKLENFRYAEASYNLGRVYTARGQSDLAIRAWRRAIAVDPKHQAAAQALARVGTDGSIVVESPSRTSDKPRPVSSNPPAKPNVKTSLSSSSVKPLTLDAVSFDYLQRARNASERGNMLDAVDNFRRVLSRQGGYFAPANLEMSYALLNLKKYDEAIVNLLEVSNREGARYPVSYFHLARVYEIKGELKLAEAAFQKAADAYGSANSQFLLDLSRVKEKQGDVKGALEALERYVTTMQNQGQRPSWADDRLAALREKAASQPK